MTEEKRPVKYSDILSYYEAFDESSRLSAGVGLLEFVRIQELISRSLPSPPAVVLDVGGGPGRYSCWLAGNGYKVHLVDPVQKHLEQARAASLSQPNFPLVTVTEGDARLLGNGDDTVDAALLMGPLYHLPAREDRLAALREAYRVLKPGGVLLATAINRFASLLSGLANGFIDDPTFVTILRRDLEEGQHRGVTDNFNYFTTAFFHRPEELESEVGEAGFGQRSLYGVQGPGELVTDLDSRLREPAKRARLLDLIRSVEQEKIMLGMSNHFVIVAKK